MKLNELPKRKKIILFVGVSTLVILLLLLLTLASGQKELEEEPRGSSVSQPIPEADLEQGPDGKTDSYVRSGITDYWDSLEGQQDENLSGNSQGGRNRRPGEISVDDIFGDMKDDPAESVESKPAAPVRRSSGGGSSPAAKRSAGGSRGFSPKAEEKPDESASSRIQIKKSGAVSSLDDDVVRDLGNGFSTLNGDDMWVQGEAGKPYRCMFTRDEKVSSGQRISLRLLEDLVIDGVHIPQNTHLQGVCKISDRMEVAVTSLDIGGKILSFYFEAYDTDGGKGIYCSDLSKTAKDITNQGVNTALSSLNSRIGSAARDAATLGASIVRTKSGEVSVSVPAGYMFYIIEEKRY